MRKTWLLIIIFTFLISCDISTNKNIVFVSILPQKYFVKHLAENFVEIEVMVEPDENPATYEVTPRQMAKLAEAKQFYRVGVPFEQAWLPKISKANPNLEIFDTREGINLRYMTNPISSSKNHSHSNETKDPHIWLSPLLVKIQAENISKGLISLIPNQEKEIKNNLASFKQKMQVLHNEISEILDKVQNRKFLVFHPSWGYFAEEFELEQIPIEIEGKTPNSRELAAIIKLAKQHNIKNIFVQKQFSTKVAEAIAEELNANIIQIDPLAENYYSNLIEVAQKMKEVLDD
ncbi:MAG: zinc ABC transporter substrate-binding protein [Candidatus Cloacimonadota bacterium]|nr:zinc ABC transporter substrate-binding protein [Candidatus Cloacimonadota bacterium]